MATAVVVAAYVLRVVVLALPPALATAVIKDAGMAVVPKTVAGM